MTASGGRLRVVARCLICGGEARTAGGPAVLVHDPQCPEVSLSDAAALARELLNGESCEPSELARLVIEADRKLTAWIAVKP